MRWQNLKYLKMFYHGSEIKEKHFVKFMNFFCFNLNYINIKKNYNIYTTLNKIIVN